MSTSKKMNLREIVEDYKMKPFGRNVLFQTLDVLKCCDGNLCKTLKTELLTKYAEDCKNNKGKTHVEDCRKFPGNCSKCAEYCSLVDKHVNIHKQAVLNSRKGTSRMANTPQILILCHKLPYGIVLWDEFTRGPLPSRKETKQIEMATKVARLSTYPVKSRIACKSSDVDHDIDEGDVKSSDSNDWGFYEGDVYAYLDCFYSESATLAKTESFHSIDEFTSGAAVGGGAEEATGGPGHSIAGEDREGGHADRREGRALLNDDEKDARSHKDTPPA